MEELAAATAPPEISPPTMADGLPFGFAKQHGVLLSRQEKGCPLVYFEKQPDLQVVAELRRFLGCRFQLQAVSSQEFQRRLTQAYQRGNNEAVQMAEDIGADVDLSRLADEIPDTADLMDAEGAAAPAAEQ